MQGGNDVDYPGVISTDSKTRPLLLKIINNLKKPMRCEAMSEGKNIAVDSVAISKDLKADNSRPAP